MASVGPPFEAGEGEVPSLAEVGKRQSVMVTVNQCDGRNGAVRPVSGVHHRAALAPVSDGDTTIISARPWPSPYVTGTNPLDLETFVVWDPRNSTIPLLHPVTEVASSDSAPSRPILQGWRNREIEKVNPNIKYSHRP